MRQKTARGMHAEFSIEESAEKHCLKIQKQAEGKEKNKKLIETPNIFLYKQMLLLML
jgi:type IV secretory pathway VirD2 relaxase